MMRYIVCLVFLFSYSSLFGQESQDNITIAIDDKTLEEVFLLLEDRSPYKFYYAAEWLGPQKITRSYTNTPIQTILDDLLQETNLNYYIGKDNRIILLSNNRIRDALPDNFFTNTSEDSTTVSEERTVVTTPVLLAKEDNTKETVIENVRIGKENNRSRQAEFTLSGKVINALNERPMSNVSVFARDIDRGSVTDTNGNFELRLPPGPNLIEVTFLGFETVTKNVIIYSDGVLDFNLNEASEELDEIVINADALNNINQTTTGTSVITAESIKDIPVVLGERNILKVATTMPGVTTAGEGSEGFNVRGGKSDQNLILLDNAVIYKPSHFFGLFEALNPLAVNDVKIYKGSMPVDYGGRLSSVFDVQIKDASTEKIKGNVSVGPVTANALIELPIKKESSGLLVGARAAYSDWVLNALKDTNLQNSEASFYDGIVKYNHKIDEKNDLSVTGYYSSDRFSITSDSLFSYTNRLASVRWNHQFSNKSFGSLNISNSAYTFNIDFDGSTNANFKQEFSIDETEVRAQLRHVPNDTHRLNFGIVGKYYKVRPGNIAPRSSSDLIVPLSLAEEKGLESAIFVSDEIEVSDKLLLDIGFRYSFYMALGPAVKRTYESGVPKSDETVIATNNFGNNESIATYSGPEFRFSSRYFLDEDLSIKASYNNVFQYIQTLSNSTTVSPIDTWKLTDNHIRPQEAQQVSLGLYKNINIDEYEISLEGYYKTQKNITDFKTGAQLLLNEYVETEVLQGEGKSYGVEFLIKKNVGKLNGWLGYTYSRSFFKLDSEFDSERVNDGDFFPSNFDKPHDASMVLNYELSQRVSFSGNFVYQTGRPVTFPVGYYTLNGADFVLYSDRNKFRIPDYYRLDLGLNIEGNHKKRKLGHSFWNISVYNVLGRNNPYSVFFVTEEGEVKALQSSIFSIPVPSITFNFSF